MSCSADRQVFSFSFFLSFSLFHSFTLSFSFVPQAKAKITKEGIFLEALERNPSRFLPEVTEEALEADSSSSPSIVNIDLNQPMTDILQTLTQHPIRTRVNLSGDIVVARDIAHAKLLERLQTGQGLPEYIKNHIIYYAGPAKTPEGYASGSFRNRPQQEGWTRTCPCS